MKSLSLFSYLNNTKDVIITSFLMDFYYYHHFLFRYMWEKDGVLFEPNDTRVTQKKDSGTLIISNYNGNMKDFQGKYRCSARNELGTAVSNEVHVITEGMFTINFYYVLNTYSLYSSSLSKILLVC